MGGAGSGRHIQGFSRATVESYLALDVRRLHRDGRLRPRQSATSSWRWVGSGKPAGSIAHHAIGHGGRAKALVLVYEVTRRGNSESVKQGVWLDWTPCNYGGSRPWFLCPRCNRRVAVLYGGARFYCRHCHGLAYTSTRESSSDRGIRKARKIHERLGGTGDLRFFPPKPKGMHWRTYWQLRDEAHAAYTGALRGLLERLGPVVERLERGTRR